MVNSLSLLIFGLSASAAAIPRSPYTTRISHGPGHAMKHHADPQIRDEYLDTRRHRMQARSAAYRTIKRDLSTTVDLTTAEYALNLQVGHPQQSLNVTIDTGGNPLWVIANCTEYSCPHSWVKSPYVPALSSSAEILDEDFGVYYTGFSFTGYLVKDHVSVGTLGVPGVTLGAVDTITGGATYTEGGCEGSIGLGRDINAQGNSGFWRYLVDYAEDDIAFSLRLAQYTGTAEDPWNQLDGGEITFGSYNSSIVGNKTLNFVPLDPLAGFWSIAVDAISINDVRIPVDNTSANVAIIDSGSPGLQAPVAYVEEFFRNIPGSNNTDGGGLYWTYPCDSNIQAAFEFGGQPFTIHNSTFNVGPVTGHPGQCHSTLIGSTSGVWAAGQPFLSSVYSVFRDGANPGIAFIQL